MSSTYETTRLIRCSQTLWHLIMLNKYLESVRIKWTWNPCRLAYKDPQIRVTRRRSSFAPSSICHYLLQYYCLLTPCSVAHHVRLYPNIMTAVTKSGPCLPKPLPADPHLARTGHMVGGFPLKFPLFVFIHHTSSTAIYMQ